MAAADHLQVPRQHGLFQHHGIDLGDGTVAHYLEGREILRSTINEFCNGQPYKVVVHAKASTKRLTLSRAISRIGEQNYNLLFNNCEHFANWCKTGRHKSPQMEGFLESSSLGAIAIGQFIPAACLKGLKLLLKKGLEEEDSRQKAIEAMAQLSSIRQHLRHKLEVTLEQLEQWVKKEYLNNQAPDQDKKTQTLLLKGQALSDQLSILENLEAQVSSLISCANSQK